jgi:single-stranded-DNA-specific exonuclease
MGDAETGIRALTTSDPAEARRLAAALNDLNDRRQNVERQIVSRIEEGIRSSVDLEERRTLVFAGKGWHRGVLGIVASKIAEKYCRPTVVLDVEDGVAAGSARSINGFDLYSAIARLKPLLSRFGGHTHAAGLSLESTRIEEFRRELEADAKGRIAPCDLIPTLEVDARLEPDDVDLRMVERLQTFGPFGRGNPEPVFHTAGMEILEARRVGERHLRFKLRKGAVVLEGIGFGLAGRIPAGCGRIDLVYTPVISRWQGLKRLELKVLDLQESGGTSKLRETRDP